MHDFRQKNVADMNFEPLAEKVRYFKENEGGRGSMCKIVEDLRKEARDEERNDFAIKLLKTNKHSVSEIAELTSLPIEEVEKLKKNLGSDK